MDAGKLLFARISEKKLRGTWLQISIKVSAGLKEAKEH